MSWIPSAISGVGALGALFGGHGDNGASGFRKTQQHYLDDQNQIASRYGDLANTNLTDYNQDHNDYRRSMNDYANYLHQDPYTDQYSTAALNRATAGTAAAYQAARSHLQSGLAQRGLDTASSGGPSSVYGGGLAAIENGYAGTMADAQNQLAYQKIQHHEQNMQGLMGLYGNQANQDYALGTGALGTQSDMYDHLASKYGNFANNAQQEADAYHSQLMSGLGAAGQLLGQAFGPKAKLPVT